MSRKTTPTNCFLSRALYQSQCSEGEMFVYSAKGKKWIEEGRQDCWNAGEKSDSHLHIFLTVCCKQE